MRYLIPVAIAALAWLLSAWSPGDADSGLELSPDLLPRRPLRRPWEGRARHARRVAASIERSAFRRRLAVGLGGEGDSPDVQVDRGARLGPAPRRMELVRQTKRRRS